MPRVPGTIFATDPQKKPYFEKKAALAVCAFWLRIAVVFFTRKLHKIVCTMRSHKGVYC